MTYKAIIYSVPGTGTRFCKKFLEDVLDYKLDSKLKTPNSFYQVHSSKINFDNKIMKMYPGVKLVTPIRDPYLSYITRNLMAKNAQRLQEYKDTWVNDWKALIETTSRYPTVFLPIDCDEADRLYHLIEVGKHLGACAHTSFVEFANEWPIVDSKGMSDVKKEYLDRGTIDGEKPFFLDFAVEWIKDK